MTNSYQMWWLGLVMGSGLIGPAQAELHGRWPLTPGGSDYQAAYDDVLDITWMTDARLSDIRDWDSMVIWADGLSLLGVDDWRLASLSVSAGVPTGTADSVVDCETATEQACRDNELGYMYYYNLPPGSGINGDDKTGTQIVGDVTLTNIDENIFSGTEGTEILEVWAFDFDGGTNDIYGKGSTFPGWAVRDGDIGLIDPIPPVDTCDGFKIEGGTFDSLTFIGESCLLLDVTVNGDLTVINADTFTIQESEVSGNITVQSSKDVSFFDVRSNTVLAEDNVYFSAYAMIVEEMQVDRNETAAVSGITATYLDCQDNVNLYSSSNGSSSGNNCRADIDPPPDPDGPVDLSGTVYTTQGETPVPLCAMVLASGEFQFSCNPNGPFELTDLPREGDGTVKRQVYVDGFFPNTKVLEGSTRENVYMQRAQNCPDYNAPYDASESTGSAGDRVDISGQVLLGTGDEAVCAMVLANGEFMFSCDGTGNYALNVPLDAKGQFKLQVYADGFAPNIQVFDEFSRVNDVRMARSSECD